MVEERPSAEGESRPVGPADAADITKIADLAGEAGLQRVSMLAWRDLDDPEAGGSEVHASTIAKLWAEAGLEVTIRTSFAAGKPQMSWRDGYRVIRKAGRYMVFPRAAFSEMMGWHGGRDGLIEIWNGMPFFSPVWAQSPRVVWLHHIHAQMWQMALPPKLAMIGSTIESRIAPPLYRFSPIITLSRSSKQELVDDLHFNPKRVHVVPPGIDPRFSPAGPRSDTPLVVAVGRLVPVKRFDFLIEGLVELQSRRGDLQAVIVGEGYCRDSLERQIHEAGAESWIALPGHVDDATLIELYRRAWALASVSVREGFGMTLTEAAACGTPAVATRIAGHEDAVVEHHSGLLVDNRVELVDALDRVLGDDVLRAKLSAGALQHASGLTWGATALSTLEVLATEAIRRRGRR